MLSIEECRALIPDCDLTDKELEELRDNLYGLANLALDDYFENKNNL